MLGQVCFYGVHCHRVVSQIAEAMTAATASGCEISVRCGGHRNSEEFSRATAKP